MLIAFYGYKDNRIEALDTCDTNFRGFFYSPKFRDLCKEHYMNSFYATNRYDDFGFYLYKVSDDKTLYVINSEATFREDSFHNDKNMYNVIIKVIRDYKIEQLIQ